MSLTITVHTDEPLTPLEQDVLRVLLAVAPATNVDVWTGEPAAPDYTALEEAAAQEVADKPAIVPEKESPAVEETPEPSTPEAEADLGDAVALATDLVSKGETKRVKAALAKMNVKRVSELKGASIQAFMDELNG